MFAHKRASAPIDRTLHQSRALASLAPQLSMPEPRTITTKSVIVTGTWEAYQIRAVLTTSHEGSTEAVMAYYNRPSKKNTHQTTLGHCVVTCDAVESRRICVRVKCVHAYN